MKPASGVFKKIVVLVLILAVPGFLYYLLQAKGKNRYRPLAIYGPKRLAKTFHKFHGKAIPDTVYHAIADFNLTDQDGKPVSLANYNGKIVIFGFFYTQCPTLCKQLNYNLASLAKAYVKNKLVYFVSVTVDPSHDTSPLLHNYAAQFGVPATKWKLLTGDSKVIYSLSRNSLLVNALQTGPDEFIYSDKLILIDAERRIRGYYSGTKDADVALLNDEIKVQISEELRKIKAPYSF